MKKVFLDHFNTIDSVEWHHKGYVVYRNPSPSGYEVGNRVCMTNYLVARPGKDTAEFECHSLADAKASIEEDLLELASYKG